MLPLDLELDEERFLYKWEIIEGSEDYVLCDYMEIDDDGDDRCEREFLAILRYLQEIAPHIRWRFTYDGLDSPPSRWKVICVPEHQFVEAQYVVDRYLQGDDLSNYSYTDRYPEVYEKSLNGEPRIKDNILKLFDELRKFENILSKAKELGLSSFLQNVCTVLPKIYVYAGSLPYVEQARDLGYHGSVSLDLGISLDRYDECLFLPDPYKEEVVEYLLSKLLISIYEEVEQALFAFETKEPDQVADAVNDLKCSFTGEYGWGADLLRALYMAHIARAKIESGRYD